MAKANENLFCNCNSNWKLDRAIPYQRVHENDYQCMECELWMWHDAYYEDILFDLRNMNLIW